MAKTVRLSRPVIAITGSAGKSTTKEMLASILSTRWRILKSVDNCNFFTHTRQYATRIRPEHRALVLEYGMSGPGQIKKHCQIIEPNYAVITNIGSAHIGAFGGDVRKLAQAKSELIRWMKPTGTVVLNQDDANTNLVNKGRFHGTIVKIGITNEASYRAQKLQYTPAGMEFTVKINGRTEHMAIPVVGRHHVYNALCAIAIADLLGFKPHQMRIGLRKYKRMNRRTTIYRFKKNIFLIDDSYSSNPDAAKAAIDTLTHVGKGRKIAVLGSMRVLGNYSTQGHAEVGRYVAKKGGVSQLYTFGPLAKRIGTAAAAAGFPGASVVHFTNKSALHHRLFRELKQNTTILIKASHGVRFMDTADLLRRRLAGNPGVTMGKHKKQG